MTNGAAIGLHQCLEECIINMYRIIGIRNIECLSGGFGKIPPKQQALVIWLNGDIIALTDSEYWKCTDPYKYIRKKKLAPFGLFVPNDSDRAMIDTALDRML